MRAVAVAVLCTVAVSSTARCSDAVPSSAQAKQFHCMLINIYHEARGDTVQGMQAVALVTLNRSRQQGKTVCEIVYQRKQFSWTTMPKIRGKQLTDNYDVVHRITSQVMRTGLADFTGGATHYHTHNVKPRWAKALEKIDSIGAHIFYRKKSND